jgi:hypothetical protein
LRRLLEVNGKRQVYNREVSVVRSVYFDDARLSACRANLDGLGRRHGSGGQDGHGDRPEGLFRYRPFIFRAPRVHQVANFIDRRAYHRVFNAGVEQTVHQAGQVHRNKARLGLVLFADVFGKTAEYFLQAVPQELLEAAALDGAGAWQRFRQVTLPAIRGVVLIATLLSMIWTFADFQLVYILTKGGPANETHIFGTYAYQIGLGATEIGMGAAIALYMFPILSVFAVILLVYLRREE